jgi:hypothetical protein
MAHAASRRGHSDDSIYYDRGVGAGRRRGLDVPGVLEPLVRLVGAARLRTLSGARRPSKSYWHDRVFNCRVFIR